MTDWAQPDPLPVVAELDETYQAEPYTDPWNSIMQRLDPQTIKELGRFVV